jgi:hypothetical protein
MIGGRAGVAESGGGSVALMGLGLIGIARRRRSARSRTST